MSSILVPMVLKREGNAERSMDLYSRLLEDRIISVHGPIEPEMADIIRSSLLYLESRDSKADIRMYISSPGGHVDEGMGIYDVMNYVTCDIQTVCWGKACSMGSLLLAAGTKGKRFALPNAEIMIHQPSGGSQGKASDMEIQWNHMVRTKKKLTQIYADITGKPYETCEQDMDRDNWMTAEEAKEYGLIDEVIAVRG